ncbi:alpha/beta fold hydrolase [Aquimarina sp. 2304DJ70-9]|uniref:alpha/beta fold hydrolase n=1 Tax=Aquimarina penaris TaxID=3231044 RepID=UPI003462C6E7
MIKKIFKWVLIVITALISGFIIYGSISQRNYDKKVLEKYQPEGKFIELSEGRIHYKFFGEGKYTFILEAGLGENMETWSKIQDSLSLLGRVFMYDRSGLGFSDQGIIPRTTEQIAIELNTILSKANIPGPYIMIGHSIGGAHVRYFAHMFPENIVGLFLIDPSHEKMKDDLPKPSLMESFFLYSMTNLSWSGIPYFMLPEPPHPTYKTTKCIKTYGEENRAIDASIEQFKKASINLSDLPIYIVSASKNDGEFKDRSLALYQELIDHSNHPIKKLVDFENSPHHIHVADPNIVLKELNEFMTKIESNE